MNRVLLVDGMALLFRGYYATAFRGNFMKNELGIPTNGIFQFLRYLFNAINKFEPTHVICCWDMGRETFRNELYEDYKANREDPPEELVPQFDLVKRVTAAYEMKNIGIKNFEADDCIGSLTEQLKTDHEIIILSGDYDLLQLVDENVQVAIMLRGQGNYDVYHEKNFYEKQEIHPEQIVEMKGLMGDSADNYPGVKGIGEVTALKLIKQYGTIEELLNNLDDLTDAMRTRIKTQLDMLHLSKELATIKRDLEIDIDLSKAKLCYDEQTVKQKLTDLNVDHIMIS